MAWQPVNFNLPAEWEWEWEEEDGRVQSGKWLQRCVRNKLFFFFGSYSAALIYCPPMWTWWEQLTARGLELQQIWMRQSGRCRLCKLYFLQPEKNPRASDKLCYDRTSRHGLLPISRYEDLNLCLKPCTYRFYMEKQAWEKTSMLGAEMTRLWIV